MADSDHLRIATQRIQWARDNALYRDLAIINEMTRKDLGAFISNLPIEAKRKPAFPRPAHISTTPNAQLPQEADDMNLRHLAAVAAVATSGLMACQQDAASASSQDGDKSKVEHVAPIASSDMRTAADLFASDSGRRWQSYDSLPQVKWIDPTQKQYGPGRYSRSGKILLLGFTIKDIPNGRPGPEFEVTKRNEGESILSLAGSQAEVESISISKPLYSDNYLDTLKKQFGSTAEVSTIAEKCSAGEYEEGAGEGAFFAVSIPDKDVIYVQASQQDGGKYTAGYTVFNLTRSRPSEAIAQLNCKQEK